MLIMIKNYKDLFRRPKLKLASLTSSIKQHFLHTNVEKHSVLRFGGSFDNAIEVNGVFVCPFQFTTIEFFM